MNNPKIMSLKAKLEVDLQSIKRIESELKSLAKSFGQFKEDVKTATQGMDKTIQQAFFGKKGTNNGTIKTFFKNQFKTIIKSFTEEIRNASKQMVDSASGMSGDTIAQIATIILQQQKKIEDLTKNAVKKSSKVKAHPVYGKLTKEQYGSYRDSNAFASRLKEEEDYIKFLDKEDKKLEASNKKNRNKKFKLSDDDNAFRAYYLAERDAISAETKRTIAKIAQLNKMWEKQLRSDFKSRINELTNNKNEELAAMNAYYSGIERFQEKIKNRVAKKVPQAVFTVDEIGKNVLNQGTSYRHEMNDMKSFYTKQAADSLKAKISLNIANAKALRKVDDREYQTEQRLERQRFRQGQRDLRRRIRETNRQNRIDLRNEQNLADERRRLREEEIQNAADSVRTMLGIGQNSILTNISSAPLTSFVQGFQKGFDGITGMVTSASDKLKTFFKIIATGAVAGLGAFAATGAMVKKLASGVLFATEKMRGYEIALFGMMKTQDGVNQLMEKAFKVTKNLPISYEQVYQSTKAFTLIGPVRDMLKNVGETETVLKRMYSITMALSQIEPEWGLAGAQFSLREALSGDLRSLQRRFEIPVNLIYSKDGRSLRDLKNDPEAMSQALSDYFKEFYNEETLGMAANQFGAVLGKIEGFWFNFQSTIGNSGFYDLFVGKLKNVRDELDKFSESMEFKDVSNRISNALGSSLESTLSIIKKLVDGFGKLIGINTESSNAFQFGTDVIEKFAAVLRIIDRFVTEVDIFGKLNEGLEKTKALFETIVNFGGKMFKSIANDIEKVVDAISTLPLDKLSMGEIGGKGIFYLWLFGPGNIIGAVTGFSTMVLSTVFIVDKAIRGAFAANTLLSNALGLNIMKWGGAIVGMVAGFEQIGGTAKFAFDSIDAGLESSIFYKMYAWLTGTTTAADIEKKFSVFKDGFNLSSDVKDSLKIALTKEMGLSGVDRAENLLNKPDAFIGMISESKDSLEKFSKALNMVEDDLKTVVVNGVSSKKSSLELNQAGQLQQLRGMVKYFGENPDAISTLAKKQMRQGDLNADFEGKYYGRMSEAMKTAEQFWHDTTKSVGNAVDAMSTMIKPLVTDSEKALFAARSGTGIFGRGDAAINNIDPGTKIAGAAMLDVFKAAGYGVGMTSGWRDNAKPGSAHNVNGKSFAIDYQPKINGKLLTAADTQTPQFEALVNSLKSNEAIANIILEYKDKSIFGDKFDGMTRSEPEATGGPVIHMEFKKGLADTENGIKSIWDNLIKTYSILAQTQQIVVDELGKKSPQLVKNDFLKQNFQRATEFITNVYHPMMNATKEGYDSVKEIFAEESNLSESLFKGMEDDGVAKAGPRVINKLNKSFDNYKAMFKEGLKTAGGENWMALDVIGREVRQLYLDMGSYIDETGILTNRAVQENAPKPGKNILSRYSDTLDQIALIFDFDNMWEGFKSKELSKQEKINTALWKDTVRKKTFEYVSMFDGNIQEIQNQIMQGIASEAFTKVAYDSGMNTEQRSVFDQTLQRVMTRMKIEGVGVEQALSDIGITDNKMTKHVRDAVKLTEQLKEQNLEYKTQKTLVVQNLDALKKYTNIQQLSIDKSRFMGDKESRSGYYGVYETLMSEGQGTTLTDAFKTGIGSAQNANYQTEFQMMYEAGKELNNSLVQTFETGFFDMMEGKINSLANLFNNLGTTIKNVILGVIAKMLAISATKIVLGIDITGGLTGGTSGGGLMGAVGSIFGGGSSGGGLLGNLLGSFGTKATSSKYNTGDIAGQVMGAGLGIPGLDLSKTLGAGVTGAIAGTKGTGILGKLTGVKDFLMSPAGLATIGAAAFLTQPGRLFGGTKDKTGEAQATFTSYTDQRKAMINRRSSDAIGYYMGGTSGMADYQFGGIGYDTWTSGDGWFKGPKEKHAAADPTAFLKSMEEYYKLLMTAGKTHYQKTYEINKLAETNSLKSLKQQYEFESKKQTMIQMEYDRYASNSYKETDKWEKMDEYREELLQQEQSNMEMLDQIHDARLETQYAEMTFLAYMKSGSSDSIEMAKTAIEIEKMKFQEFDEGTTEWYNAKISLLDNEKSLTQRLNEATKQMIDNIKNVVNKIYKLGQVGTDIASGKKISDPRAKFLSQNYEVINAIEKEGYGYSDILDYTNIKDTITIQKTGKQMNEEWLESLGIDIGNSSNLRVNRRLPYDPDTIYSDVYYTYTKTIEEILEDLNKDTERILADYELSYNISNMNKSIAHLLNNVDTTLSDKFNNLANVYFNYFNDTLLSKEDRAIGLKETQLDINTFVNDLASDINGWLQAGYFSIDNTFITSFSDSLGEGLDLITIEIYEDLKEIANKLSTKSNVYSSIKDMEDFSLFNQVMNMGEMSGMRNILGYPKMPPIMVNKQIGMKADGTMTGDLFNIPTMDYSMGYDDPYQLWFDFNKGQIEQRIENTKGKEGMEEEYYQAEYDLYTLLIDNAQRLKEKADEVNRSIEDMLGKIEETMRMRIAEERTTTKGDIMFIDVGSTRNSQAMLDKMLAAIQTNDPKARELVEEFRKKMSGIGR